MSDLLQQIRGMAEFLQYEEGDSVLAVPLADLEEMLEGMVLVPEWIDVNERRPEAGVAVLISDGEEIGHARRKGRDYAIVASNDPVPARKVRYWMPEPSPPQPQETQSDE